MHIRGTVDLVAVNNFFAAEILEEKVDGHDWYNSKGYFSQSWVGGCLGFCKYPTAQPEYHQSHFNRQNINASSAK